MRKIFPIIFLVLAACTFGRDNAVSIVSERLQDAGDAWSVEVTYPQVRGLKPQALEKLNANLKDVVDTAVSAFMRNANAAARANSGKEQSTLRITFVPATVSDTIVSVIFTVSERLAGAAHTNEYYLTSNQDVVRGASFSLRGIVQDEASGRMKLGSFAGMELSRDLLDAPFTVEQNDIVLWLGIPESGEDAQVRIPKNALIPVLNEHGRELFEH